MRQSTLGLGIGSICLTLMWPLPPQGGTASQRRSPRGKGVGPELQGHAAGPGATPPAGRGAPRRAKVAAAARNKAIAREEGGDDGGPAKAELCRQNKRLMRDIEASAQVSDSIFQGISDLSYAPKPYINSRNTRNP